MKDQPTASLIIIGNEILSGRTQDANLNYLATELAKLGIRFAEARVIPDDEQIIIDTVNTLRMIYDYVFTTGGIGPTHDDITASCIAKAFGVEFGINEEALARLEKHYKKEDFNEARKRMAYTPAGVELIDNPISTSPGFRLENVYVMAGVPVIMQAMLDSFKHTLKGGAPVHSHTLYTGLTEGTIAEGLGIIQNDHPEIEIGSYPHIKDGKLGVSLVVRSQDSAAVQKVSDLLRELITTSGGNFTDEN